jgi:hypothetical protein
VNPGEPNPGLERVKFQLRADGIPDQAPNPLCSGIHSRGYLPHVKREGASYFVTFRLVDSLPKEVLLRFEHEHAEALRRLPARASTEQTDEVHRELRRKIERCLDQGRTGETFWQRESYDHWIRNDDEKARIRRYIRMNPVNARLCQAPEDWKWSSAWPGWGTAAKPPP